mmetsp:Transcript_18904/g.32273  ORF Transcript_18904/g.32273 Transcript_18904/m.32273 type:complete len:259 (-) Transcript_18904:47-823(-)
MHSGMGGGICPNVYNILNCALARVQDFKTQEVIDELQLPQIPEHRLKDLEQLGKSMAFMKDGLPMLDSTLTMASKEAGGDKLKENVLLHRNNFWRSQLAVIGMEGLPSNLDSAGNVIYKGMKFRCSLRLPPRLNSTEVVDKLKKVIEAPGDEYFGASVKFECIDSADGFDAPDLPANLKTSLNEANAEVFGEGKEPIYVGCGGSIPFMEVFSKEFPEAFFLLMGVGFPDSNAHSANENLRLEFTRKLTTALSLFLSKL